jgi:phosphodiesterase/alkaline phosphatase D-like protein
MLDVLKRSGRSLFANALLGVLVLQNFWWSPTNAQSQEAYRDPIQLTHGPMLGNLTSSSVVVWGRTSDPGQFSVRYGKSQDRLDLISQSGETAIDHDNTGTVQLVELEPNTRYFYQVWVNSRPNGLPGSFRTLPSKEASANLEHNPKGLFNFRFPDWLVCESESAQWCGPSFNDLRASES